MLLGHCDPGCACFVNGEHYAVGEKWASKEDPCTVFECFTNGFVEAISQGKVFVTRRRFNVIKGIRE